jgi:hypothetical protein
VDDSNTIPEEQARERRWANVRQRMESASAILTRQGSVATRVTPAGSRVASVRYFEVIDGRRRQRVIYLGADEELVRRARELIGRCREGERWIRETEEAARFVVASGSLVRRMLATGRRGTAGFRGC